MTHVRSKEGLQRSIVGLIPLSNSRNRFSAITEIRTVLKLKVCSYFEDALLKKACGCRWKVFERGSELWYTPILIWSTLQLPTSLHTEVLIGFICFCQDVILPHMQLLSSTDQSWVGEPHQSMPMCLKLFRNLKKSHLKWIHALLTQVKCMWSSKCWVLRVHPAQFCL